MLLEFPTHPFEDGVELILRPERISLHATPARLASNARRSRKSIQATPVEENHVPEEQEESDEVVSSDLDSLSDFMSSEDTSEDENGNVSSNNEEEDSDSGQSKNIFHKDLKATRLNFNDDNESM